MDPTFIILALPFVVLPFVFKHFWPHNIGWGELAVNVGVGVLAVAVVYFAGRYSAADDIEIWNGEITGKTRDHGHYLRSYDCNCTTTCSGSGSSRTCTETCQTCYEDRYTVNWDFQSTIGLYNVKHLDRSSRSVYNEPDPPLYANTNKGDACSREKSYVNWVKAVPDSLYNQKRAMSAYADKIPEYPRVRNLIHVNRVLAVDASLPPGVQRDLNKHLNDRLKHLGPVLQMNLVMIVTGIQDPSYRYAVENAWIGGKKNDAVIFVGVDENMQVTWTDIMTFANNKGNELFQVRLRDALTEIGNITDTYRVSDVVSNVAMADFTRIEMAEFERLKEEIDPPTWVIVFALLLGLAFSGGVGWFSYHYEWRNGGFYRVTTSRRSKLNKFRFSRSMFG